MSTPGPEKIKQFLYGELSEDETRAIEEQMFADSELFYELTNLEHDLVDDYVRGRLQHEELVRFEQSLLPLTERKVQVANARALQRLIGEQSNESVPVARATVMRWSISSGLFRFQSPVTPYVIAAVLLFFAGGAIWLFYERNRIQDELAQTREQVQRERNEAKRLMDETKRTNAAENGRLSRELSEREERLRQLNQQLESLRAAQDEGKAVYTATITASIGSRGPAKEEVIKRGPRILTVRLPLETGFAYDAYAITDTNGGKISHTQRVVSVNGRPYLVMNLPAKSLRFSVIGINRKTGAKVTINEYQLEVRRH